MAWMRSTTRSTACELLFLRMQFPQFQILKSGHNAEHGRSSAAVINIVSRQGGVRTHGDLFGLLRSRHVSASNPFAGEPDPGDTNTQAGFTLGGSLRKEHFSLLGLTRPRKIQLGSPPSCVTTSALFEIQNSVSFGIFADHTRSKHSLFEAHRSAWVLLVLGRG